MGDNYATMAAGLTSSGIRALAVTPSDSTDLNNTSRAIWVGGAGNLAVVMANDNVSAPVTLVGVPAGTLLPIRVRRVMSTNTTATSIVAID